MVVVAEEVVRCEGLELWFRDRRLFNPTILLFEDDGLKAVVDSTISISGLDGVGRTDDDKEEEEEFVVLFIVREEGA